MVQPTRKQCFHMHWLSRGCRQVWIVLAHGNPELGPLYHVTLVSHQASRALCNASLWICFSSWQQKWSAVIITVQLSIIKSITGAKYHRGYSILPTGNAKGAVCETILYSFQSAASEYVTTILTVPACPLAWCDHHHVAYIIARTLTINQYPSVIVRAVRPTQHLAHHKQFPVLRDLT